MKPRTYVCQRCGTILLISYYVMTRWDVDTADRCGRCGAVHHLKRGEATVISPVMLPIGQTKVVSPWQLHWTRPIVPGNYEARFHDIPNARLTLWWDGHDFTWDGQRVSMATLSCWRGSWQQ